MTPPSFTVNASELRSALMYTRRAAATENTRYSITGLLFELDCGDCLRIVATDGRRLHAALLDTRGAIGALTSNTISAKSAKDLSKLSKRGDVRFNLDNAGRIASAENAGKTVLVEYIEGSFPKWRDVVPVNTPDHVADVLPGTLVDMAEYCGGIVQLDRAATTEHYAKIKMLKRGEREPDPSFVRAILRLNGAVTLSAASVSSSRHVKGCTPVGEPRDFPTDAGPVHNAASPDWTAFNAEYLAEAFAGQGSAKIELRGPDRPLKMTYASGALAVLMPVNLG